MPRPRRTVLLLAVAGSAVSLAVAVPASSAGASAAPDLTPTPIYLNTQYSAAERAADLVSRMTLEEKVLQLHTNSAPAIPRLGVQAYTYWSEGQHGVNRINDTTGDVNDVHATSFPTNFASTMSWDPSLIYDETTAISDEARGFLDKSLFGTDQNNLGPARSDYGNLTYWAPTVNLDRDPRWGRTDEAFGEDPYLVGRMAGAFVNGYQGQSMSGKPLSKYLKVAATAKHYALNNVEDNRTGISSDTTDVNLHDYYVKQFQALIEQAKVSGLMTSYNAIDGTPSVADTYTTNQIAQRSFGFDGYITSDCGAVGTTYQTFPSGHDWAPPGWTTDHKGSTATWTNTKTGTTVPGAAGGQAYALRAGTGLNCTGAEDTVTNIEDAIHAGILSEGVIDTALVRIFTIRMRTGEFDPRSANPYNHITKNVIESPAHQKLAEQVGAQSLVLLKNQDVSGTHQPLLPVQAANVHKVVVLGNLANTVTLGGYSGAPSLQVNAVQGITSAVQAASPGAQVVFDAAGTSTTATDPVTLSATMRKDIKSADLVVVFVGTDATTAGEGHDRSTIAMPGNYDSLINRVAAVGNPRTALVVQSDGPVSLENVQNKVPAIVFSGYNGESQGNALADVMFGKVDPSAHLDFTWYRDDSQLPDIQNYGLTPDQTGGLGRTYQYFTGAPTYPFGYGLSYTHFAFTHLSVSDSTVHPDDTVRVSVTATNTGQRRGATVAQLYAATPFSVPGVQLPKRRLAGFAKTDVLAPGASQRLTMSVPVDDLSFWDAKQARDVVYDGPYDFQVAANASDVQESQTVTVSGARHPHVQYVTVQPEAVQYAPGATIDLTGRNRWIQDDTDRSLEKDRNLSVRADHVVEAVNDDGSFVDLGTTAIHYTSSDRSVARVDSDGTVTTVAPGVATISATVRGVTGSAVIDVAQPLRLRAAAVAQPGESTIVHVALPNTSGTTITNARLSLTTPKGWTATATSPTSFPRIASGQTATATWRVDVPAKVKAGPYSYTASATYTSAGRLRTTEATTAVSVPYPSFAAAIDSTGISSDSDPASANFDGGGSSYSAEALAAAGLSRGDTVTQDGVALNWPDVAPGTPDNVVASGQTVKVTGTGDRLALLGAGDYGSPSGTLTLVYTDGTTQEATLGFADWYSGDPLQGTTNVASPTYINNPSGRINQTVHVYGTSVPLAAGKTLAYVTLPAISESVPTSGALALHVFALGVG